MHITLRQLEVFTAIARHQQVRIAAASLHMSQPAASMALAELEKQLNTHLFDRYSNRLTLNDQGQRMLALACELLGRANDLENLFLHDSHALCGSLSIGTSLTIGSYLLPGIITTMQQEFPGIEGHYSIQNSEKIIDKLLRHELDAALIEGICHHPSIEAETWREDRLVIVAPREHPLTKAPLVSPKQLAVYPWIVRETGSGTRALFDYAIVSKLPNIKILLELEQTEAIKQAVIAGLGLACLSELAVNDAILEGKLSLIETPFLDLKRHFYLLTHHNQHRKPTLEAFLALCHSHR
ncbi:LysR family transcriptional regulator [Kistimonas scapharcae]|uniref:LysR family transcriptional regulator n=1 Tax=Kistimonas scapharcae TaxID=1036133 RepID=A0ABP8UWW0_9GAMM